MGRIAAGGEAHSNTTPFSDPFMARRRYRKRRTYKIVNVASKSVGASGDQILLGKIKKLDAQGVSAWVSGVKVSGMLQEAEQDTASLLFYLTTDNNWDDDYIVSAAATGSTGGSVWLSARRYIKQNATPDLSNDIATSNTGPLFLWVEAGDYVASEAIRYVAETWGNFIQFEEL